MSLAGRIVEFAEHESKRPVGCPTLHGDVDIVAGLRQRVIERVVGRDLLASCAPGAVELGKAHVATAVDHASQACVHDRLVSLEPRKIASLGYVAAGGQNPVAELLHRHVAEAASQVGEFVAAAALWREIVMRAHVVAEADAARLRVVRAFELRFVGRRRSLRGIYLDRFD